MEMKTSHLLVVAIILAIFAGILIRISNAAKMHRSQVINSYDECVAAGNPILESYPAQCRTEDGRTFINPNEHLNVSDVFAPVSSTTSE